MHENTMMMMTHKLIIIINQSQQMVTMENTWTRTPHCLDNIGWTTPTRM